MSIALLYERSENDEKGIKLTAEELGLDLFFIPFRKIAVSISNEGYSFVSKGRNFTTDLKDVNVVLNRTQSKNRRLYASNIMEALGKNVINPTSIEFTCYSKFRTLLKFWISNIPIPKTVYVPCDSFDTTKDGKKIQNALDIAELFQKELGVNIVIKPDAGTHGKGIVLSKNHNELVFNIEKTEQSIINPVGIVSQELIDKWFYDLRIIVSKEKGKCPVCHPVALARAGFNDFRTNTFLGNLVFDCYLPLHIRDLSVKCGNALSGGSDAWVFALDAMINVGSNITVDEETLKKELTESALYFESIKKIKKDLLCLRGFKEWNLKLEMAFQEYMNTETYNKVKNIIQENVNSNKLNIVFHEANSCPEFWEQTRLITGLNVAIPLLRGAQSLL